MRQGERIETLIIPTRATGHKNRGRERSRSNSRSRTRVTVTYRDRRPSPIHTAQNKPKMPPADFPIAPSPSVKPARAISYRIVSRPHSEERRRKSSPPASRSRVVYSSHYHHCDDPSATKLRAPSPITPRVQPASTGQAEYGRCRYGSPAVQRTPRVPSPPPPLRQSPPPRRPIQAKVMVPVGALAIEREQRTMARSSSKSRYKSPPPQWRRDEDITRRDHYAPFRGPRVRFQSEDPMPHRPASPESSPVRHRYVARYDGHDTSESYASRYFHEEVEEDEEMKPRTKVRTAKWPRTFNKFVMGLFPHT
jgi:hypothetical protein